jgi:hypothetical protein
MYEVQTKGVSWGAANFHANTGIMTIIDEDYYNTDGNGMILVVEREDHRFGEAAAAEGPFVGQDAEAALMPGARWMESPNDVIEAWYGTFHDSGQLVRPNTRAV